MRVIFCGNPSFAVPTLEALIASSHEVVGVLCSPDKPRGRGRKQVPLPVKASALAASIPILQPESLKSPELISEIRSLDVDCLVVVAFRILPRELFALPRLGSFNVHPSLLPRGRGPAPIRWTLIRGESVTGVSIIQLTEQIDGGAILAQQMTPVGDNENYGALHDRLASIGASMMIDTLNAIERGHIPEPIKQDNLLMTKAPKLSANDYQLDWNLSACELCHRIRAFAPSPGAVAVTGEFSIKILDASILDTNSLEPGEMRVTGELLAVGTADKDIQLKRVKPMGKSDMAVSDYLRGRPVLPKSFRN